MNARWCLPCIVALALAAPAHATTAIQYNLIANSISVRIISNWRPVQVVLRSPSGYVTYAIAGPTGEEIYYTDMGIVIPVPGPITVVHTVYGTGPEAARAPTPTEARLNAVVLPAQDVQRLAAGTPISVAAEVRSGQGLPATKIATAPPVPPPVAPAIKPVGTQCSATLVERMVAAKLPQPLITQLCQ